jgi:hypothetical protein
MFGDYVVLGVMLATLSIFVADFIYLVRARYGRNEDTK